MDKAVEEIIEETKKNIEEIMMVFEEYFDKMCIEGKHDFRCFGRDSKWIWLRCVRCGHTEREEREVLRPDGPSGPRLDKGGAMHYAGAEWVKAAFKVELSPLGADVANLLGRVFLGIYHLPGKALERVDWRNETFVEFIIDKDLSTFDFNELTAFVVYAHDEMIRISIVGCGSRYMKMIFHKRHKREGSVSERYPTIETHIEDLRRREKAA